MPYVSPQAATAALCAPISMSRPPVPFSGTATTTAALLTPDIPGNGMRLFSVVNLGSANIAVVFVPAGQAPAAESVASGRPIPAGGSFDFLVEVGVRVLIVASANSAYGGIVRDF
jgi:hypothetical protein